MTATDDVVHNGTKRCTKCGAWKALSAFRRRYRDCDEPSGRHSRCEACEDLARHDRPHGCPIAGCDYRANAKAAIPVHLSRAHGIRGQVRAANAMRPCLIPSAAELEQLERLRRRIVRGDFIDSAGALRVLFR